MFPRKPKERLLLLVDVNLEANDISVLNFTLSESQFGLHELNHARFDFLHIFNGQKIPPQYLNTANTKKTYLEQFEWCPRCPSHPLIDYESQISNSASSRNVDLSNTIQRLSCSIEMLEEDHNRARRDVRLVRISDDVEIQA